MHRPAPAPPRRTDHGPKSLVDCGSFATLARKAGALDALDRALRQTLPLPLRDQVKFANVSHGRLVFLASSPAWASRLRLMQTQILAAAAAIGTSASAVTVKVTVPAPADVMPEPSKSLSPAAAAHLRAAAASTADPDFRELFLDLASLEAAAGTPSDGSR